MTMAGIPELDRFQALHSVTGGFGVIAPGPNQLGQTGALVFFIFYDQNFFLRHEN